MMSIFASVLWLVASGPLWELYRTGFTMEIHYQDPLSPSLGDFLSPSLFTQLIAHYPFA